MAVKNKITTSESKCAEIVILLLSIAKWVVLAGLAGGAAGVGITYFLKLLHIGIEFGQEMRYWWVALPVAGAISSLLILYVSPESYGHGTEAVIRSVNRQNGRMPLLVAPIKTLATAISISFGASAGKEGPSAQIGASLASTMASVLRLTVDDHQRLTMCGLASGFSVITGAPVAGSLFAMEALRMGQPFYSSLLPVVVSSMSSIAVARWLGWWHPLHAEFNIPAIDPVVALKVGIAALFVGLVAWLYIEAEHAVGHMFHKIRYLPLRTFAGGIVLVLLALLFSRRYLGLGVEIYEEALAGMPVDSFAFALKILFVAVTLGSGFSGGAMTPVFVIGAAAGASISRVLGLDSAFGAAIGIVGLLAGAANTPIAAVALGLEAFGSSFGSYALMAASLAYVISGHRSINATQMLGQPKSIGFAVDHRQTCEDKASVWFADSTLRSFRWLLPQERKNSNKPKAGGKGKR